MIIVKIIAFALFSLLATFVMLFGEAKTGIRTYFAITGVMLLGVILF